MYQWYTSSMIIGLLQCDHVADDLNDINGDYQDMFSKLIHDQDDSVEVKIFDLTADKFPHDLAACDGYIITGSQFSAYDDIAWIDKAKSLVRDLNKAKIPTIGICFGHQLIAESLGGKVEKEENKGWGVGVQHWQMKIKRDWMGDKPLENLSLLASHQDQVVDLPKNSTLIASSDFCPIAGFQTGLMLTLQGHPEFTRNYNKALISKRIERIGQETVDTAIESLNEEIDSDTVGRWMVEFIRLNKQQ